MSKYMLWEVSDGVENDSGVFVVGQQEAATQNVAKGKCLARPK